MKIQFISDVHGSPGQLAAALAAGRREGADQIAFLGDVFVSGHTHIPLAERRGGIFVFNPGSVGLPKEGRPPSYGMWRADRLMVKALDGTLICDCPLGP